MLLLFQLRNPAASPATPPLSCFSAWAPRSLISLVLLGLTVLLSANFYLWVLRYVCAGSCQPVAVDCESQTLAGIVSSQVKQKPNKTKPKNKHTFVYYILETS